MSEVEQRERQFRVEDAKEATKAALEEGIISGGGAALVHAAKHVLVEQTANPTEEEIGESIIQESITKPCWQILTNACIESPHEIIEKIAETQTPRYGFNVLTDSFCDMIDIGIIDPLKVVRLSLQNAVSVASLILTTEDVVVDYKEEK